MKKLITLALALIMALTLAACSGGNNDTPSGGNTPTPSSNTPSDTDTPAPTPTDNPQPGETPGGDTANAPVDGEFLYAAVGFSYDGTWSHDSRPIVTKFHAVDSFLLFFTGDTTGDWLPPAISDVVLYIDGVPQQAAISENVISMPVYYTDSEALAIQEFTAQYISNKRDDVTKFTFWLSERYENPGEYRLEATVNGAKISSNTFIWRGGTDVEYLDDMPVLASPPALTAFSWPDPGEITDFIRSNLWDIPREMVGVQDLHHDYDKEPVSPYAEYIYSVLPDFFKKGAGPLPDALSHFSSYIWGGMYSPGVIANLRYELSLHWYDGEPVTADDALTLMEHYRNSGLDIIVRPPSYGDGRELYNPDGTLRYFTADFSFEVENGSGTGSMEWSGNHKLVVTCNIKFNR